MPLLVIFILFLNNRFINSNQTWITLRLIAYVSSTSIFINQWNHSLSMLLSLELIIVSTSIIFIIMIFFIRIPIDLILVFFTVRVCEARVGVALLINFSRKFGKENLQSIYLELKSSIIII